MTLPECNQYLLDKNAKRNYLSSRVISLVEDSRRINNDVTALQDALVYCQDTAVKTQQAVRVYLEDIVNQFLDSIIPGEYTFKIDFVVRRNKTECDLLLLENDNVIEDPLSQVGGTVCDIISIALRLTLLLISGKQRVLVLDEPGRNIDKERKPLFFGTLSSVCSRFDIQVVCVTHDPLLVDVADRVIVVSKKNGVSSALIGS